jgi:phage-related protein (TIGR01555 family)
MDVIQRTLLLGSKIKNSIRNDGWSNIFTGLGTSKDKRTGNQITRSKTWQREAELLHDNDDIAKKIVNEVPKRGTAKWIDHKVGQDEGGIETANKIVDEFDRLEVKKKFRQAWAWARLYGGSGVYMAVDDGLDPSEPLNLNRIVRINSLTVLHRYELQRQELEDDINNPNFGLPRSYTISGRTVHEVPTVHHSRILRFDGSELSEQEFKNNDYWHDSVLNSLKQIIADYNGAYSGIAHAMTDFDVSVLKLKNLADIIGSDDDDLVVSRLKLMNLSKSILGSILIDAEEEDFDTMNRQFTNVDKVLDKMDQRLVQATDMPHTVILGEGSSGNLSGSGESEEKNMNTLVAAEQDDNLKSPIDVVSGVIMAAKQGPTNGKVLKSHSWTFNPLSEPSEKQIAETRKLTAETDAIYLDRSVVSSTEIAESRFGGDEYSMETAIDLEARNEQDETEEINPEETKKIMKGIGEENE